MRYAEVLLNKAEAYARMGDLANALVCLNEIRSRVGLPERTAANEDEFMKHLRHERMVELATGALSFSQVEVDAGMKRLFPERFYLFSLPVNERSNNKLLGQNNPGW